MTPVDGAWSCSLTENRAILLVTDTPLKPVSLTRNLCSDIAVGIDCLIEPMYIICIIAMTALLYREQ